jgi:hypothetical protein
MISKKTLFLGLLTISLNSVGVAHAALSSLDVTNNTSQYSTVIINNGMCSSNSALGKAGVTDPKSHNPIPGFILWIACHAAPSNCKADVYMSKNCGAAGDPKVATIIFDISTGIKSITMHSNDYLFTGGGFSITLDGGPTTFVQNNNYMMW